MKYYIALVAIFLSFSSIAQQITYKEWQEEAKTDIILQPEYGNVAKTPQQIKADNDFITLALKSDTTPRKASEHLISLGFNYLYRGDLKSAMSRFNLAWLIDHNNENSYWGFGAIYATLGDQETAFKEYDKGLLLNPKSSNILTDKATIYMVSFEKGNDIEDLKKATQLFMESYSIDSKNQNTLFKLSICYFLNNDCTNAWRYYNKCEELGGKPISEDYSKALKEKCSK